LDLRWPRGWDTRPAVSAKRQRPSPQSLGLPRVGVESHAHLDYEPLNPEALPGVIERAGLAGVERIGNVFLGCEAYRANSPLLGRYPEVFFLLGVHPGEAGQSDIREVADMAGLFAADPRLVAVGEIGLDLHWEQDSLQAQERFFREQLALAMELEKPVAVHSRDAWAETLAILDESRIPGEMVLWHCFGLGPQEARELLRRGYTVSIPGPVTYSRNEALRQAVALMDLGRLVIESDAPFLTPEPYRGLPNEPAYTVFTAARIAQVKGLEPAHVWRVTGENAKRFYGL
jgi:TatD DNase family protein